MKYNIWNDWVKKDGKGKGNYILFTKLPWPGYSEGTFRSSSQAAACPPVYHTRRRLHTVPLIAERQAGKLRIPIFMVFGLTRPGTEPESTASVADALSTRLLIGWSQRKSSLKDTPINFAFSPRSTSRKRQVKFIQNQITWSCWTF